MRARRKSTAGAELATELDSWAALNGVSADPYIQGLSKDLKTGRNLSNWATLNPMEFLPSPEPGGMRRLENLVSMLTVTRNVLVFLPVALTWIAVSKATTAFSAYTNKNSIAVVNFLEFWQDGYGVLAEEWTIGRIAFLDFLLIMVVIALTLLTAVLGRRNQQMRREAVSVIENDRTAIALRLSLFLNSQQKTTPLTFDRKLTTALDLLVSATDSLDKSVTVLSKSVKELPSHRDLLLEIKAIKKRIFGS